MSVNIREYLDNVMKIELLLYEQQCYVQSLNDQLQNAQNPVLYQIEEEKKSEPVASFSAMGAVIGIVLAVITGFVSFFAIGVLEIALMLFRTPFYVWLTDENGEMILMVTLSAIAFLIPFLYMTFSAADDSAKEKKENEELRAANQQRAAANELILANAQQKVYLLSNEISQANELLMQTENTLQNYYNMGIIYRKYWGLVPVVTFNEYFESGRVNTLPEAYDRYEQERRLDLIVTKLDDVIYRLDQIEDNQYMLANAINSVNCSVQNLASIAASQAEKLEQINANQTISNYYNSIIAQNTSYMAWIAFNR